MTQKQKAVKRKMNHSLCMGWGATTGSRKGDGGDGPFRFHSGHKGVAQKHGPAPSLPPRERLRFPDMNRAGADVGCFEYQFWRASGHLWEPNKWPLELEGDTADPFPLPSIPHLRKGGRGLLSKQSTTLSRKSATACSRRAGRHLGNLALVRTCSSFAGPGSPGTICAFLTPPTRLSALRAELH